MRLVPLLAVAALFAGCLDAPPAAQENAGSCGAATTDPGSAEGRLVRVYVGNDSGKDTCVNVRVQDALFVSVKEETAPAGLHATPLPVRDTHVPEGTLRIEAEDTANGFRAQKEVEIRNENHVVVLVGSTGISIQVYEEEPQFA